jgi:nitroreductase
MNFDTIIEERTSVRKFKSKKPDWRTILECLDATRFAPMAGNQFSPRFILVDQPEKIKKIAEACDQEFIENVHYLVAVCSEKKLTINAYKDRGEKYIKQQAGAAIENFLLKITESGLATCWVGHFYDEKIKHILKIPDNVDLEALFPIGYAYDAKPKKRKKIDLDTVMYFNEYKNPTMHPAKKMNV